ncbi:MAG: serine/threonine protein phosphatase [Bacteroidetes bacterium]|nr:MAG: serine/threonine protein phosphatase [Bacteroidota bacterium]
MQCRWVIGDIHGCINTFRHLVEQEIRPSPGDSVFLLGDLIDRGPDSKGVVDYVVSLQDQSIDARTIRGNHEVMLLEAGLSEEQFALWMRNGGYTTLEGFGIPVDSFTGPEAAGLIPPAYLEFFNGLPWYLETEGFFLVHAGLNPISKDPLADTDAMIWSRHESYHEEFLKGRKLVHGHTFLPLPQILTRIADPAFRIINLDGGCVYRDYPGLGNLLAWNLDDGRVKIVPNRE